MIELQQIGASHPRIKQIVDLQKNASSNRARRFVAEGIWANDAVLAADASIDVFLWCPEASYSDEARARAATIASRARSSYRISPRTLERITERDKPDGLVSVAELPTWDAETLALGDDALVLVADAIEIPGNLGTLIRSMDACAADALVLTNRRTRLTHPKVFRGSHGTVLTVPSIEIEQPDDVVRWLRERDFTVYLADTDQARPYREVPYGGRTAIVLGNERYGISRPFYEHGFDRVSVPMLGAADSLNVAISASVLLYEARAQKNGW
ncbi:MAG: RNA methyltransferase [Actinomycetota bacterium]|nr:RNA methyltransferase [Actinomycetota bacterium]